MATVATERKNGYGTTERQNETATAEPQRSGEKTGNQAMQA